MNSVNPVIPPQFILAKVYYTKQWLFSFRIHLYCPFLWMCHGRTLNNRIFRLQERLVSVIYKFLLFRCLLSRDSTEIPKHPTGIAPKVFANMLISMPHSNFSPNYHPGFSWIQVRSVFKGTKIIALLGPKLWDLVLLEIKHLQVLHFPYFYLFDTWFVTTGSKLVKLPLKTGDLGQYNTKSRDFRKKLPGLLIHQIQLKSCFCLLLFLGVVLVSEAPTSCYKYFAN